MNMAGLGNSPEHEIVESSDGPFEESPQESKLDFSEDEEDFIAKLYDLLGQSWALIAGRIPGRTAEEIEKYCRPKYSSSSSSESLISDIFPICWEKNSKKFLIIAGLSYLILFSFEDVEKCCIYTYSSSSSTD